MIEDGTLEQALATIADLKAQNARLRRLLDQINAPAELRHRLRSTLSVLRSIIHRSVANRPDLDDYVAHLDDRVEAIARAQSAADMNGGIDLKLLLAEEFLSYGLSEGEALTLSGPDLMLSARIGQALALALHELAVNSVEHGSIGLSSGQIDVSWDVENNVLQLEWKEVSSAITPSEKRGFGSEFILEALPYQFNATTSLSIVPGLVHCTIEVPLEKPSTSS